MFLRSDLLNYVTEQVQVKTSTIDIYLLLKIGLRLKEVRHRHRHRHRHPCVQPAPSPIRCHPVEPRHVKNVQQVSTAACRRWRARCVRRAQSQIQCGCERQQLHSVCGGSVQQYIDGGVCCVSGWLGHQYKAQQWRQLLSCCCHGHCHCRRHCLSSYGLMLAVLQEKHGPDTVVLTAPSTAMAIKLEQHQLEQLQQASSDCASIVYDLLRQVALRTGQTLIQNILNFWPDDPEAYAWAGNKVFAVTMASQMFPSEILKNERRFIANLAPNDKPHMLRIAIGTTRLEPKNRVYDRGVALPSSITDVLSAKGSKIDGSLTGNIYLDLCEEAAMDIMRQERKSNPLRCLPLLSAHPSLAAATLIACCSPRISLYAHLRNTLRRGDRSEVGSSNCFPRQARGGQR
jgi:hypothetical protein